MLGEAGATVYCTGRSSREQPNTSGHHHAGRPETIEETAEMVDAAGGVGVPVRVDHTVEAEVVELFKRVNARKRAGRARECLDRPRSDHGARSGNCRLTEGRSMVEEWIWPHVVTCRHAVPLMVAARWA